MQTRTRCRKNCDFGNTQPQSYLTVKGFSSPSLQANFPFVNDFNCAEAQYLESQFLDALAPLGSELESHSLSQSVSGSEYVQSLLVVKIVVDLVFSVSVFSVSVFGIFL